MYYRITQCNQIYATRKSLFFYNSSANDINCLVGRMIVLPSKFIGSPRFMMQNYQDAMVIVRSKGKSEFFITMKCNPNWR